LAGKKVVTFEKSKRWNWRGGFCEIFNYLKTRFNIFKNFFQWYGSNESREKVLYYMHMRRICINYQKWA
jgi:hypothetical protein